MQYVCLLRLGRLARRPPMLHHRLRQVLLPYTTCRASHGSSKEAMGGPEKIHEQQGPYRPRPGITDARLRGRSSPSQLHHARQVQRQPPRHRPKSISRGTRMNKEALLPLPETKSTFTPRDMRVQFVKEFDSLEDESQKLAKVLHRFTQTEKHQRDRLRYIAAGKSRENTISRFAAWKSALKDFHPESTQTKPMSIIETRHVEWIKKCATLDEMIAGWPSGPARERKTYKDSSLVLISAAVRHVPDKVHLVFEAALSSPYGRPHWYIVEDIIELLAMRLCVIGLEKVRALAAQKLAELVVQILIAERKGIVQFSQITFRSILDALPADAVGSWYQQLLDAECDLHPFTEVRFAGRLAKSSSTKVLSAKVLMRLQETKLLNINTPMAASVATTILSFSKEDLAKLDEHCATPADLFRDLHSVGLIPNVITYTAIIRGLCLKEDLRTALDVFEVMQQHGVPPNEWTYAILLHGCKVRRDWTAFADIAIQACNANVRENVVWNEVLHAIYICCLSEPKDSGPRRSRTHAMNSIYSRVFDAIPIKPFITGRLAEMGEHAGQRNFFPEPLRRLTKEIPPLPPQEVKPPGSDTLSIMLLGLIRTLPLPYDVVVFYSQYRQLLRQGHPVAKLLVEERGSFVHDIILRNLLKWPGTLRVALDIIRDMMRDVARAPESASGLEAPPLDGAVVVQQSTQQSQENVHSGILSTSEPRRSPIPHPAPSIYTWTVLVHGFMRARQPEDAEYIMTLMRSNGIEPNLVTWNTLAAGYAKMQRIPEAVNAMRRLEAEGHEADDWTMRAFSYIGDKAKAVEVMEATVEANKAHKMAVDLQREQELGAPSLGEGAAEAEDVKGEVPQDGSGDCWPRQDEVVAEDQEETFLDGELEARLDMGLDTYLDADVGGDVDKLMPNALSANVSSRIYQSVSSRKEIIRKLEESAPIEGNRYDTEGWRAVKKQGLDALSKAPVRPAQELNGVPQVELTKTHGELRTFSDAELDAIDLRIKFKPPVKPDDVTQARDPV